MEKKLLTFSFFAALSQVAYIFLISLVLRYGDEIFGAKPGIFGIIAALLLFVVSAAISGALILGKPALLYLEGKKKEALQLFILTVSWLILFLVILLLILFLYP